MFYILGREGVGDRVCMKVVYRQKNKNNSMKAVGIVSKKQKAISRVNLEKVPLPRVVCRPALGFVNEMYPRTSLLPCSGAMTSCTTDQQARWRVQGER